MKGHKGLKGQFGRWFAASLESLWSPWSLLLYPCAVALFLSFNLHSPVRLLRRLCPLLDPV
jgi:hypothetical protein